MRLGKGRGAEPRHFQIPELALMLKAIRAGPGFQHNALGFFIAFQRFFRRNAIALVFIDVIGSAAPKPDNHTPAREIIQKRHLFREPHRVM